MQTHPGRTWSKLKIHSGRKECSSRYFIKTRNRHQEPGIIFMSNGLSEQSRIQTPNTTRNVLSITNSQFLTNRQGA